MWPFPATPPAASNWATLNDGIFYVLCALSVFFTVIVVGAILYFCVRYRVGTKADRSRPIYEDLRLELSWTLIPLVMALVMFFFGADLYVQEKEPPANARFALGNLVEHRAGRTAAPAWAEARHIRAGMAQADLGDHLARRIGGGVDRQGGAGQPADVLRQ